nr:MAG TPA: hypothetical protein [Caudoviricetes sp.]
MKIKPLPDTYPVGAVCLEQKSSTLLLLQI